MWFMLAPLRLRRRNRHRLRDCLGRLRSLQRLNQVGLVLNIQRIVERGDILHGIQIL